jgi:hypothetical protein
MESFPAVLFGTAVENRRRSIRAGPALVAIVVVAGPIAGWRRRTR